MDGFGGERLFRCLNPGRTPVTRYFPPLMRRRHMPARVKSLLFLNPYPRDACCRWPAASPWGLLPARPASRTHSASLGLPVPGQINCRWVSCRVSERPSRGRLRSGRVMSPDRHSPLMSLNGQRLGRLKGYARLLAQSAPVGCHSPRLALDAGARWLFGGWQQATDHHAVVRFQLRIVFKLIGVDMPLDCIAQNVGNDVRR